MHCAFPDSASLQRANTCCFPGTWSSQSGLGLPLRGDDAQVSTTRPGMRGNWRSLPCMLALLTLGVCAGQADEGVVSAAWARELQKVVPQLEVSFADFPLDTGPLNEVRVSSGFLIGPKGRGNTALVPSIMGDDRALRSFLETWPGLFGGGEELLDHAVVTSDTVNPENGVRRREWQYRVAGIKVSEGGFSASTTPDNELVQVCGGFIPGLRLAVARAPHHAQLAVHPPCSAIGALRCFANARRLDDRGIRVVTPAKGADQEQELQIAGADGPVWTRLEWSCDEQGRLRLYWRISLIEASSQLNYTLAVDVITRDISGIVYSVYPVIQPPLLYKHKSLGIITD